MTVRISVAGGSRWPWLAAGFALVASLVLGLASTCTQKRAALAGPARAALAAPAGSNGPDRAMAPPKAGAAAGPKAEPEPRARLAELTPERAERHRAVEQEKRERLSQPHADQTLTPEIMADPEIYHPGPGPHAERYDHRSGALAPHLKPSDATVTTVLESDGPAPKLAVWVPNFRVSASQPAVIHALVVGADGKAVEPEQISVTIVEAGTGVAHQGVMVATNGRAEYVHSFEPPPPKQGLASYSYAVFALVRVASGETEVRTAVGNFQVHRAVADVDTARISINSSRGSIVVDLPVVIAQAGSYTFYAELWAEGDAPVCFALEPAKELGVGRHVVELLFGGNIIRDRGLDGPYAIRNLRVRNIASYPFEEADPVELLGMTPAWKAATFGD